MERDWLDDIEEGKIVGASSDNYEMPDEIDFSKTVHIVGGLFDPDPKMGQQVIEEVAVDSRSITFFMLDGRIFSAPIEWYPELARATPEQRKDRTVGSHGHYVHWKQLRFALSPLALIRGIKTKGRAITRRKSA
jgi:hypothetical protein